MTGGVFALYCFCFAAFSGALVKKWDGSTKREFERVGKQKRRGWDAYRLVPRLHCQFPPGPQPFFLPIVCFYFLISTSGAMFFLFKPPLLFYVCTHTYEARRWRRPFVLASCASGLAPGRDRRYPSVLDCLYTTAAREKLHQLAR